MIASHYESYYETVCLCRATDDKMSNKAINCKTLSMDDMSYVNNNFLTLRQFEDTNEIESIEELADYYGLEDLYDLSHSGDYGLWIAEAINSPRPLFGDFLDGNGYMKVNYTRKVPISTADKYKILNKMGMM